MTVHICHLLWSFRTGGLENGVVNLINQLDTNEFRHSIICLTDYDPAFFARIKRADVQIFCLNKNPGHDLGSFKRCYQLLRQLKPDICHSRNLAAMEYQLVAWLARVPHRVHGEHGWDLTDIAGQNRKYVLLKRLFKTVIQQYICLSKEGQRYLQHTVGVPAKRLSVICNGVDTERFSPAARAQSSLPGLLANSDRVIFGTVGRIADVKNQQLLVTAYIAQCQQNPDFRNNTALVLIGDGQQRSMFQQQLTEAGLTEQCWLPGDRSDIAQLLPGLSVFVLPSLAEGISNTILEAMACGVPVIASDVGGNPELVQSGHTGWLFQSGDQTQLMQLLQQCQQTAPELAQIGLNARAAALQQFSLNSMVAAYRRQYFAGIRQQEG